MSNQQQQLGEEETIDLNKQSLITMKRYTDKFSAHPDGIVINDPQQQKKKEEEKDDKAKANTVSGSTGSRIRRPV